MRIVVKRTEFTDTSTIGEMSIDGKFFCYTLEDKYRQVDGKPVSEWKIPHQTAIPKGTYKLIVVMSPRKKILTPRLVDVEGYSGILIHSGNVADDSEGCLLVGTTKKKDFVGNSKKAFNKLMPILVSAVANKEDITITIE